MICPPEDTLSHPLLQNSYMKGVDNTSKVWDIAVDTFKRELCDMSLREIYDTFDDDHIPLYNNHQVTFHSMSLSAQKLQSWFQFQFGSNWLTVIKELEQHVNVVNSR